MIVILIGIKFFFIYSDYINLLTVFQGKPFIEFEEDQTERSYYDDYYVEDLQVCRLPGYDLTYALFNRFPS